MLSSVFGGIAAKQAAKTEKRAQDENLKRAQEDRDLYLDYFRQSRGSKGSAFLPLYFGEGDTSFERVLGEDAVNTYNATKTSPWQEYAKAKEIQSAYMPMQLGARGTVENIFSGELTNESLRNAQPVMAARTAAASAQQQAINTGLQQTLNEIKAMQKQAGFSGTGSFAQNRMLNATIGANQQAAQSSAAATLQNAMEEQRIRDAGINLRLNSLDTPYRLAANEYQFMEMPQDYVTRSYLGRVEPFQFFRTPNYVPNLPGRPQVSAIPSDSQIFWSAAAQSAKDTEDMAMQAASMYFSGGMSGLGGGGGGGGSSGPNYLSMAQSKPAGPTPTYGGSYGPYASGYRFGNQNPYLGY